MQMCFEQTVRKPVDFQLYVPW